MVPFATEFPVAKRPNRAAFVAEVIAWLQGTSYSNVLNSDAFKDMDAENAHLRSSDGEELRFREHSDGDEWRAIGFRHDFPDSEGRLWRTEAVLRRGQCETDQDHVRFRTQCLALEPDARLERPRKPYLIKAMLKNGWGAADGELAISDSPVFLPDDEGGLATAKAVTLGRATHWLPVLYVSAVADGAWLLSSQEIDKLAYDLGGLAHVVVEPSRSFSFQLRDACEASNAYGGTIALSVPNLGIVRRFYLGWQIQDGSGLAAVAKAAASDLRGKMPASGWDWTELQEQALRAQRLRDKSRLTSDESEQLFLEEIANLQDRIGDLERQVMSFPSTGVGADDEQFSMDNLVRLLGPEVYSGEISDRLRLAAKVSLSVSDQVGLDQRSKVVFGSLLDKLKVSPALAELNQDLIRATKDPKKVAKQIASVLSRHGYFEKSDNKHIRLEARGDFIGLESITLPKTPSEGRGLKNLRSQINNTLGITKLSE
ncbi:hypothetical protein [Maricaulis parjimensis]|uniref:hypothetical protein n=1 Tax=Maricaulis parjimensis TaxID=144023 RepID=UPI001939FB06|nr:hypothetical protein [Maricaulis parjimensis]